MSYGEYELLLCNRVIWRFPIWHKDISVPLMAKATLRTTRFFSVFLRYEHLRIWDGDFLYRYYDYDYDFLRHKRVRIWNRETSSITLALGNFEAKLATEKKKRKKRRTWRGTPRWKKPLEKNLFLWCFGEILEKLKLYFANVNPYKSHKI